MYIVSKIYKVSGGTFPTLKTLGTKRVVFRGCKDSVGVGSSLGLITGRFRLAGPLGETLGINSCAASGQEIPERSHGTGLVSKIRIAHTRKGDSERVIICVWPTCCIHALEDFRGMLGTCLTNPASIESIRVVRENRRGAVRGGARYDLYLCVGVESEDVLRDLRNVRCGQHGRRPVRARKHIKYLQRNASEARQHNKAVAGRQEQIASLNINGLKEKKAELSLRARKENIAVLCLQETLRDEDMWPVSIPGYVVVEQVAGGPGQRGVAVAVRIGTVAVGLENSGRYIQWVQVLLAGRAWICGSIYLPHKNLKQIRKDAVEEVARAYAVLKKKFKDTPIVIAGDWNCDERMVGKTLKSYFPGLAIMHVRGDNTSWFSRCGRYSNALDHMAGNSQARDLLHIPRVQLRWCLSDHKPIIANVKGLSAVVGKKIVSDKRMCGATILEKAGEVANNDVFQRLLNEFLPSLEVCTNSEERCQLVNNAVALFHEACWNVAGDIQAVSGGESGQVRKYFLKRGVKQAIERKQREEGKLVKMIQGTPASDRQKDTVKKAACLVRLLVRREEHNQFVRRMAAGLKHHAGGSGRSSFWKWLRVQTSCVGHAEGKPKLNPVKSQGVLQLHQQAIARTWTEHFRELASDTTQHSRDKNYWLRQRDFDLYSKKTLPGINDVIEWEEVARSLRSLVRGKAASRSGVIREMLRASVHADGNQREYGYPPNPEAKIIFAIITEMWENAYIPEPLRVAWIVALYKGKGDVFESDNYRGISLIESLAGVLLDVVGRRLRKGMDQAGTLKRRQAGFRPREECIGQVISLWEFCKRRLDAGLPTYIAFLDFKQAYDNVPHMLALLKMQEHGVRGKMLKFMYALYGSSWLEVRGAGIGGRVAESFPMSKGVRQGCPTSTDIFNLFIEDIFDDAGLIPIAVPCSENQEGSIETVGILFADDGAMLGDSLASIASNLKRVEAWAERNEMVFGHGEGKCGLMVVSKNPQDKVELEKSGLSLHGKRVAVVSTYKYLGIEFSEHLELQEVVKGRVVKAKKALAALVPLLTESRVPVCIKRDVLLARLQPVLSFGGELVGMKKGLVEALQRVMDGALARVAVGWRRTAVVSKVAMMVELGLPPVFACTSGLRARAFLKYPKAATYISSMARDVEVHGWARESNRWLELNGVDLDDVNAILGKVYDDLSFVPPSKFGKIIKWRVARAEYSKCKDVTYARYVAAKFSETRAYMRSNNVGHGARLSVGFRSILQCRVGCYLTGRRAARANIVAAVYLNKCPFCESVLHGEGEDIAHIMLACSAWNNERNQLQGILAVAAAMMPVSTDDERVLLLLGGTVRGVSLGYAWAVGSTTRGDRYAEMFPPLCIEVATFFTKIDGIREKKWRHLIDEETQQEYIDIDVLTLHDKVTTTTQVPLDILLQDDNMRAAGAGVEEDILLRQDDTAPVPDDILLSQ